jgi:hypothetical protein
MHYTTQLRAELLENVVGSMYLLEVLGSSGDGPTDWLGCSVCWIGEGYEIEVWGAPGRMDEDPAGNWYWPTRWLKSDSFKRTWESPTETMLVYAACLTTDAYRALPWLDAVM